MNSDYDALRALYRAARADEGSTPADRDAVRMGLMAAAAIGVQSVSAATASAASWSLAPGASATVASATVASAASASAVSTSAVGAAGSANVVAGATIASAKGVVQLLLGGKFLGGLVVGAAIGTAVSATAYVVDPPKAQLATHSAAHARPAQARAIPMRPAQSHVQQFGALLATTVLSATPALENPAQPSKLEAPALAVESTEADELGVADPITQTQHVAPAGERAAHNPRAPRSERLAHAPARPAETDRLLEETEALARVQAALDRKEPAVAMELLNQQRRDFSNGQLAEERSAALVLALCAAGRKIEADQARTKFLLEHPKSPLTKRVSKRCETP